MDLGPDKANEDTRSEEFNSRSTGNRMSRLVRRRRLAVDMSSKLNEKKKVPGVIDRGQPEQCASTAGTDAAKKGLRRWGLGLVPTRKRLHHSQATGQEKFTCLGRALRSGPKPLRK